MSSCRSRAPRLAGRSYRGDASAFSSPFPVPMSYWVPGVTAILSWLSPTPSPLHPTMGPLLRPPHGTPPWGPSSGLPKAHCDGEGETMEACAMVLGIGALWTDGGSQVAGI